MADPAPLTQLAAGEARVLWRTTLTLVVMLPWLFPFEITSILLLVAVLGSVVLAKRRL